MEDEQEQDEKTEKSEKTEKLELGDEALYIEIPLVPVGDTNRD